MNPDSFQQAWQSQQQPRLTINVDLLLKEVQRNQRSFTAMLFWRDVREVGLALVLLPVWIYLGIRSNSPLPWTWFLTVPCLVWVPVFMLVHRIRWRRRAPQPGEPLRHRVESSLEQVEQQIWLLRNVHWWALLPFGIAILSFFGQITWLRWPEEGWLGAVIASVLVAVVGIVFAAIYWLNQMAIKTELAPRRDELMALLRSLEEEGPAGS